MRFWMAALMLALAAACGKKEEAPVATETPAPEIVGPEPALTTETVPLANRLGPFRVGSTREEVESSGMEFTPSTVTLEGDPFPVLTTNFLGSDISVYLTGDKPDATVWKIETKSAGYETKEGAKVGDPVSRLKEVHPGGHVFLSEEEGLTYSFITGTGGQTFLFDTKGIKRACVTAQNVTAQKECPADMEQRPSISLIVS